MHLTLRRKPHLRSKRRHLNWRVWYYAILAMSLVGFLWTAGYIYQNLETSLTSTVDILLLKPQIARESFDPALFQRVLGNFENKQSPTSTPRWSDTPNPFRSANAPSVSTESPDDALIAP